MDYARVTIIISVILLILLLVGLLLIHKLLYGFLIGLLFVSTLLLIKRIIRFSITLTNKQILIKKTFIGMPYLIIQRHFDKVYYNNKIHFLSFQNIDDKIDVENHIGFEIDCLLITIDSKSYEIGDKNDSVVIFDYILNGLDILKVDKIISDIGQDK